MAAFIKDGCKDIPAPEIERLLTMTPSNYVGNAAQQAKAIVDHVTFE
jgi:hypothetical protein